MDGEEPPALVPKDWELIRHAAGSRPEILARGVLDFDVDDQGVVVFTDGSRVCLIPRDGEGVRIPAKAGLIRQVALVSVDVGGPAEGTPEPVGSRGA